ncbi:hypothetical protein K470DRAFT_270063 [Piedraia hortae CBS 480.64]|uniref:Uncharacterized protein n=1 Tax=Piedraia hortae CBS 480.64 TaxID=1314780 RepID=A0A6A7C175_9PEZI|nr:hypothetical protein K470DRAFT_270063 [Piedraia hortae CBS 480.64]
MAELEKSSKDADADAQLAAMGYVATLPRRLSTLSILGLSFAIMAVPYGLSTTMFITLTDGQAVTIFWGWVLVSLISLSISASLAEICAVFPTAGGVYYWSAMMATPKWARIASWLTGWLNLVGNWTVTLSINFGGAQLLLSAVSLWKEDWTANAWQTVLCFWVIMLVCFLVNAYGSKYLDFINKLCIYWTAASVVIILVVLLSMARGGRRSGAFVFGHYDASASGWPVGWTFFVGLLQPAYVLTGYGLVAAMCEEVQHPAREVPKAMVMSVAAAGVMGVIYLLPVLFVLPEVRDLLAVASGQPIGLIFKHATGSAGGGFGLLFLVLGIMIFAGIGALTAASRCTFAFARDGAVPGSRWLGQTHPKLGVPMWGLVLSTVVDALLGLIYFGSTAAFNSFTGVATICLNCGYALPILVSVLRKRKLVSQSIFSLGKFGYLINIICLCWTVMAIVLFCMPISLPVEAGSMNYASVVFAGFAIISLAWYLIRGRMVFKGPPVLIINLRFSSAGTDPLLTSSLARSQHPPHQCTMSEYIGTLISLISKSDIRYTGKLHEINSEDHTVALEGVRSHGTEGRCPEREVAPSDLVFEYIIFRGSDVKELSVVPTPSKENAIPDDPAIMGSIRPQPIRPNQPRNQSPPAAVPPPYQAHQPPRLRGPSGPHGFPGATASPGPMTGYGLGWGGPMGGAAAAYGLPVGFGPAPTHPAFQQMPIGPPQRQPIPEQSTRTPAQDMAGRPPSSQPAVTQASPLAQQLPVATSTPAKAPATSAPSLPIETEPITAGPSTAPTKKPTVQRAHPSLVAVPLAVPRTLAAKSPQPPTTHPTVASPPIEQTAGPAKAEDSTATARAAVAAAMARLGHPEPEADAVTQGMAQLQVEGGSAERGRGDGGRGRGRARRGGRGGIEVPKEDYDFEGANAKFNKEDLVKEAIAGGDAAVVEAPKSEQAYNRKTSFFDNISSDLRDRYEGDGHVEGRVTRREERSRNMETFGQGSVDGAFGRGYRGRGRGPRGGYRGRGPRRGRGAAVEG